MEGGECCVASVRFAGGGRDQFGGSESGASSAGGDMERWRWDVVLASFMCVRFEFSILSLPVPRRAVFRSEPFLFRVFVWRIALASARSFSIFPWCDSSWVAVATSSLDLMKGRRDRRPPEWLRL